MRTSLTGTRMTLCCMCFVGNLALIFAHSHTTSTLSLSIILQRPAQILCYPFNFLDHLLPTLGVGSLLYSRLATRQQAWLRDDEIQRRWRMKEPPTRSGSSESLPHVDGLRVRRLMILDQTTPHSLCSLETGLPVSRRRHSGSTRLPSATGQHWWRNSSRNGLLPKSCDFQPWTVARSRRTWPVAIPMIST